MYPLPPSLHNPHPNPMLGETARPSQLSGRLKGLGIPDWLFQKLHSQ